VVSRTSHNERKENTMRPIVDRGACIGSGNCVLTSPDVFDQDEEGVVVLLDEHPPSALDDDVRLAALRCPALAITVQDA
jgi:ferredoxin